MANPLGLTNRVNFSITQTLGTQSIAKPIARVQISHSTLMGFFVMCQSANCLSKESGVVRHKTQNAGHI